MATKSTIETDLNPDDLAAFKRLLAEGRLTIDALAEWLSARDYEISRSAVGRFAKKFDVVAAKMRQAREITAALEVELKDAAEQGRQGRALVELVRALVFDLMLKLNGGDGAIDSKDVMQLGKGLAELSRALRLDQDFEAKIREEIRKEAAEAAVKAAEQALDSGLDREELRRKIREDIYGIGS